MIDLHIHTYYSDGRFSPAEIVTGASSRGIGTIAICDHDNLRGSLEAAPLAQAAGIELITAVELTTRWPGVGLPAEDANVDLLGYGMNPQDAEFIAYLDAALNDIHARIANCCQGLSEKGYTLGIEDVFVQNPRYAGTLQLLDTLVRKGYAANWKEATALLDPVWLTGRNTPFTIQSAIQQLHLAGGVAVLAHPSLVRPQGRRLTGKDLRRLVDAGLDGIEIYHRRLSADDRVHFLGLAREFNLLVTGGSDTHGWHRGLDELGTQPVTEEMLALLKGKFTARL
jgi:3',5'-nucleoside bisphosphate phosphatase